MMETSRATDEISCPWCGAFSLPAATCDLCGSPMSDGRQARVGEGVTILTGEPGQPAPAHVAAEPVASSPPTVIPEPSAPAEPLLQPLRFQAVLEAATARARPATSGPPAWVRYRRSLQVRWTIEAVNY
jgi:hypothetical protein